MIIILYLFIIGSCFASFANAVIYRLPKKISICKGRSYCEFCHHNLLWYDLIPIISYLFLKGRCRYCRCCISLNYLFFECFGGFLMIVCAKYFMLSKEMILIFLIIMNLIVIAVIDYQTFDIYLVTLISLLLFVLIYRYFTTILVFDMLVGAISVSIVMMIINFFIPTSFGFGDIQLMFVTGLFLGWQKNILAFILGIISGGIYATYLLLVKKGKSKKYLPFAPFLVLGVVVSIFYGTELINWYIY